MTKGAQRRYISRCKEEEEARGEGTQIQERLERKACKIII